VNNLRDVLLKTVVQVAETAGLTKKDAAILLDVVVDAVTVGLKEDKEVKVSGFGAWVVKERPARVGRNPQTKQPVQIAASKKIVFRPASALKEIIK
jgi:DNA-binding protein HU-beta